MCVYIYIVLCVFRYFFLSTSSVSVRYFTRSGIVFFSVVLRTHPFYMILYCGRYTHARCRLSAAIWVFYPLVRGYRHRCRHHGRRHVCCGRRRFDDGQPISHALVICHNYLLGSESYTPRANGNGRPSPFLKENERFSLRFFCPLSVSSLFQPCPIFYCFSLIPSPTAANSAWYICAIGVSRYEHVI